jgi:LuxR family maltose regulon positive regulatory protein
MGEVLRERNDLEAAEALLRQGLIQCTHSGGLAEMALDASLALARVIQAREDPEGVLAVLAQAEAPARDGHVTHSAERIAVARARLWLTSTPGDIAAAVRWARAREAAWQAGESPGSGYLDLLECLTLARLHLMQSRHEQAHTLLQTLLGRAHAGGLTGAAIEILSLQARICLELGQMAKAMITLERALSLGEPEGYIRVFIDEGAPMVTLLRHAQRRGVAPAYVGALLDAGGTGSQVSSPATPTLIESLSARERELLRLLAAGLSTTEISAQLFITAGTVRNHLKSIYGKLDVHSRLQAVERARVLSLL